MKTLFSIIAMLLTFQAAFSQTAAISYLPEDSVRIESLLSAAQKEGSLKSPTLYFGRQFVGLPYVASTLEINDDERLVVNTRELDCTTFVETVEALTLAYRHGQTRFADFCQWLKSIRYRDGIIEGYPSRLHYYSSSIANGEKHGYVKEIGQDMKGKTPFDGKQTIRVGFMSENPDKYKALANNPAWIAPIREAEEALTGQTVFYIPNAQLSNAKLLHRYVHDGDILALVTSRSGLDVSHLGLAAWGRDGQLHLLNASSLQHKVVEDTRTLAAYMKGQRYNLGVRVVRVK